MADKYRMPSCWLLLLLCPVLLGSGGVRWSGDQEVRGSGGEGVRRTGGREVRRSGAPGVVKSSGNVTVVRSKIHRMKGESYSNKKVLVFFFRKKPKTVLCFVCAFFGHHNKIAI